MTVLNKPQDVQSLAIDYVDKILTDNSPYHNHKERMAYLPVVIYVFSFSAASAKPAEWVPKSYWDFAFVVVGSTALTWFVYWYCRWQLERREVASIICKAAMLARSKWIFSPPTTKSMMIVDDAPNEIRSKLLEDAKKYDEKLPIPFKNYPICFVEFLNKVFSQGTGAAKNRRHVLICIFFVFIIFQVRIFIAFGASEL